MPLYMGYAKIWVLESNNENLLKGYTMDRVSTMRIGMILITYKSSGWIALWDFSRWCGRYIFYVWYE